MLQRIRGTEVCGAGGYSSLHSGLTATLTWLLLAVRMD